MLLYQKHFFPKAYILLIHKNILQEPINTIFSDRNQNIMPAITMHAIELSHVLQSRALIIKNRE